LQVEVVSDTTFTAIFNTYQYELEVIANEGGTTTPNGKVTVDCGSLQQLTAIPHTDFQFVSWTDANDDVLSETNPFSLEIDGNIIVYANFVAITYYNVNVELVPNRGSITGAGPYVEGTTAKITCIPDECYIFTH
jgi:hypothetical protein